uniref:Uncharacterized protein n=1 Tax=Arundo donax TaxID=35708 RepID=A0A0A9G3H6_ARUDO
MRLTHFWVLIPLALILFQRMIQTLILMSQRIIRLTMIVMTMVMTMMLKIMWRGRRKMMGRKLHFFGQQMMKRV